MKTLLIFLSLIIFSYGYVCPLMTDNVCCAASCTSCGPCVNDITIDNLCCEKKITNNGIFCGVFDAPCIIPSADRINSSILLLENTTYINEVCCNDTKLENKEYCKALDNDYDCTNNYTRIVDYCCNETTPLYKPFCGFVLDLNCSLINLCCDMRKKKRLKMISVMIYLKILPVHLNQKKHLRFINSYLK